MQICLKLFDPIKTKNDVYFSKITNNDSEFTFQLEKTNVKLVRENNKAKILLKDHEIETVRAIAEEVIKKTSENSERWFGKTISEDDCHSIYKDAVVDSILHCFFDENTVFFSSKGELSFEDLDEDITGIALLNCMGVVYTKTSFFLRFEINQFKLKSEKKQEYLIKDLEEHGQSLEDENIIKKIEEITLF